MLTAAAPERNAVSAVKKTQAVKLAVKQLSWNSLKFPKAERNCSFRWLIFIDSSPGISPSHFHLIYSYDKIIGYRHFKEDLDVQTELKNYYTTILFDKNKNS